MTNVHFRMDGSLICVKKKRGGGGFKNISDEITSIKGQKKKMEHREKKLRMKRKNNYTENRKNKQTTTTTKNTKTRTHRMQNIMRITSAIVLQPIFNAYIFKGSTNFQSL